MTLDRLALTGLAFGLAAWTAADLIEGEARAVSGGVVEVSGVRIVLQGVDAMRLETPQGHEAYVEMSGIIQQDPQLRLRCVLVPAEITIKRWKDRRVGICRTQFGLDIGRELIRRGRALACTRSAPIYADDETFAARAKLERSLYCTGGQSRIGKDRQVKPPSESPRGPGS